MKGEPGGKGDTRRKAQVSDEVVGLRWKLAFGTDEEKEYAAARLEFLDWENHMNRQGEWK